MIVIKGKMPKGNGCDGCEFQTSTCEQLDACTCHLFEGVINNFHAERHPDCPIKGEIPDEHGDLIEKTEISKGLLIENSNGEKFFAIRVEDYNNMPVVVEASK